ncbi:hypothetical protein L3X38_036639 [Prunus dulcis]|uniref:Uncharacterized protein n=1 Tax=Prunus dulcis TaxID=3755 RepID=A0AAD4V3L4_PRUDU|nr:hypothetical protein L3X38_036639 [Prunus dulcis]
MALIGGTNLVVCVGSDSGTARMIPSFDREVEWMVARPLLLRGGAVPMAMVPWRRGAAPAMKGGPVLVTRGREVQPRSRSQDSKTYGLGSSQIASSRLIRRRSLCHRADLFVFFCFE